MNLEATQRGHRATVTIKNSLGLHLRPASQLVKLASQFDDCEISLSKDGQTINAKSIMGVIMLAAEQGSELLIEAIGQGSDGAVEALFGMIDGGFGEN
jgi:phosphocarrier protein